MVNESILLQKYDKDVRRIVNSYFYSLRFSTHCSFYEDLINEAFLAFLCMCRSFDLESYELTDLQRAMCKKKIESTLRVYVWKMFNMGGYNNRKIDLSRSTTISDVLGDTDLSIDEVIPNTYQDDFTRVHVSDFLKTLTTFDINLLLKLIQGYCPEQVGVLWELNPKTLREHLYKMRKKYTNYMKSATAA